MAQVFETTDPDVAEGIFREHYGSMRVTVRGSHPLLRVERTAVGRASLDHTTLCMSLAGDVDPVGQVVVARILSGVVQFACGGAESFYGPGGTGAPLTRGLRWSTRLANVDSDMVLLDPALLDETAEPRPGAKGGVRLLSGRPCSDAAAATLWRVSASLVEALATLPPCPAAPLVVASAARLLAACTLATFPNTALLDPTVVDRNDAHPATVRRAAAFIEAHPDEPVTPADIARAAHVTVRAVQLAFRRHLDTTPMAYLRRVRLDRAHADLQSSEAENTTVTAIAARWGFGQPSRFAAAYRAAYGRAPGQTLRETR